MPIFFTKMPSYNLGVGIRPLLKPHPRGLEWLNTGKLLNCYRNLKILLRKIFNLLFFLKKCPSLLNHESAETKKNQFNQVSMAAVNSVSRKRF